MKKSIRTTFLLFLVMVCAAGAQAQGRKIIYLQNYDKAPYHFGFLLGANFMDYNLILKENYQNTIYNNPQILNNSPTPQADGVDYGINFSESDFESYQIIGIERNTSIPRTGISIGLLGDLRLSEHYNLRFSPTFSLSEINYRYTIQINQLDGSRILKHPGSHNPNLCCVEFPLHLKYRSKRYNNVAAYLIAGLNPKLYFTAKKKNQNIDWLKNRAEDLALELGSGFDIYNQWFKMGIEAKFGFGLLNALDDVQVHYYAQPLKGMKNKCFQLSLTIE